MDKGDSKLGSQCHILTRWTYKVFYKAHHSNASSEWLQHIAPCVDVLWQLAGTFNDILGADQGTCHAPPDISDDIQTLMDSLNKHNVYQIQPGHVLNEGDGEPCKDTITAGVQSLMTGTKNPLSEYNKAFCLLQQRRKIIPTSAQAKSTSHRPNDTIEAIQVKTNGHKHRYSISQTTRTPEQR